MECVIFANVRVSGTFGYAVLDTSFWLSYLVHSVRGAAIWQLDKTGCDMLRRSANQKLAKFLTSTTVLVVTYTIVSR